jgi:hypothetical protein
MVQTRKRPRRDCCEQAEQQDPSCNIASAAEDCNNEESSKTYKWPEKDPSKQQLPKNGLLAGKDQLLWDALAHVQLKFDNKRRLQNCQVFVREALEKIGLGWVATNTTAYRRALGGSNKYNKAVEIL